MVSTLAALVAGCADEAALLCAFGCVVFAALGFANLAALCPLRLVAPKQPLDFAHLAALCSLRLVAPLALALPKLKKQPLS